MQRTFKLVTVAVVCQSLLCVPARASFMDDFFTSAGAAVNSTPAQIRQAGSAGFVTGGSVVWRVPNKTFTPFNWSPPSVKAGCGGIDLYLGSFGFANTTQFVDYLRNVGQNALGLFFKMALKSMSPELEGAIQELTTEINKFNAGARNSCEMAGNLLAASGIAGAMDVTNDEVARRQARGRGAVSDAFSALTTFNANPAAQATEINSDPQSTNSGGKNVKKSARNFMWSAMNSGTLSDTPDSLKQVAMSLIGVESVFPNPADPTAYSPVIYPNTVKMEDLVGTWDQVSAPITILQCDEMNDCLQPSPTVQAQKPFARIAYENLTQIRDKIAARTPLSSPADDAAIRMLAMTTLPVWKVLELTSTPGRLWLSEVYLQKYSNLIGYEMAIAFINTFSSDIEKTLQTATPNEDSDLIRDRLKEIQLRLARLRKEGTEVKAKIDANSGGQTGMISEVEHLERTLYTSFSTRTLDNLKFSAR